MYDLLTSGAETGAQPSARLHADGQAEHWGPAARLTRAGVEGVRLHDLRHFFASGLIASGCDVVTVQRALGHAKSTTTLTTYAHLWPSAEERVRDAATLLAAEVLGPGEGTVRAEDT